MGCSGHQKSESFKTSLKLAALLRFTSLEPTCWMQSKKQAKRFTMRVTKLWHILESTHLKRAMAIGYLVSDRKMQTPNAAEKTTKKDGTFEQRAFAIVLYIHCFSVLCFHVPL